MNKYEGFVGKVLDGRYKILELVGLGGMACVLKAQDLFMNRIVAIKILNDEYNGNETAEARFIDESKAVAMLSNKNIVSVYDVAIYPDIKYIVMEYLDGITLREYLDNKGNIDWKEACFYILQILRALEHAHSKGIIHRDIKPQNVMLMKNGDIKVTDFGIAKLPDSVAEEKDEKAVGTVYYISPEQACGKDTDYYSDLYSVGIMLYEAVTGTLPFTAETPMEIAMMQVNDTPVHPRDIVIDIPVGVAQIILKAMEKSPEERFQSAHTMAKAIEWVLRYPDVIFAMTPAGEEENPVSNSSVVSIDMISTAELEPFESEDLAESLGKPKDPIPTKKEITGKKKANTNKKKKKKKQKRSTSMFPIIFGIVSAFLIILVLVVFTYIMNLPGEGSLIDRFVNHFFSPASSSSSEAVFPNLVGESYTVDLKTNLLNGKGYGAKFVIDEKIVEYVSNEDYENNVIVETEPKYGDIGKIGADGKLHFTQVLVNRLDQVELPYLGGFSKSEAKTALLSLGFPSENIVFVESGDCDNPFYENEQVIGTEPKQGTKVKVSETVNIIVFNRAATETTDSMPNLIGRTKEDALKFAEVYAKFKVVFEEQPMADGNFTVIQQSIPEGEKHPLGTEVIVTISVPPALMPDFMNMTATEVATTINTGNGSKPLNISASGLYFSMDVSMKSIIESEISSASNTNDVVSLLIIYGANQLITYDENCHVYYQSVEPQTEISTDGVQPVDLVFIKFIGEELNPPEGEVPEGETPEGEAPEGEVPEGETPDAETPVDGGAA